MISGECRGDGNSGACGKLLLEGLRLQLDLSLRLVPGDAPGDTAPVWRIRQRHVSLKSRVAVAHQRAAILAGVAALGLAITFWFATAPAQESGAGPWPVAEAPGAACRERRAPLSRNGAPPAPATEDGVAADAARPVAARIEVIPPPRLPPASSAARAGVATGPAPPGGAVQSLPGVVEPTPPAPGSALGATPKRGTHPAPEARAASSPARASRRPAFEGRSSEPLPAAPERGDLLELFGDPK